MLELSGEGVLCSGELESIVVPGVTVLVTSAEVPCEWPLVSVQVVELSLVSVGPALSVELSLDVEWVEWVVMVKVKVELSDDETGCAVSVELSPWLSVDEVGRETVT